MPKSSSWRMGRRRPLIWSESNSQISSPVSELLIDMKANRAKKIERLLSEIAAQQDDFM